MTREEHEWKNNVMGRLRLEQELADQAQTPAAIEAAEAEGAIRTAAGLDDVQLRRAYGRGSDPKLANHLAMTNPKLYAAVKAEVHRRDIYDASRPGQ